MKRVIIESPFAGNCNLNVAYARLALRHSLSLGEAPIASHLLYTQHNVLDDNNSEERKLGIDAGLAWKHVAEKQIFYTDLGWSSGMRYAKNFCVSHNIEIEERNILSEETLEELKNKHPNDNSLIIMLENKNNKNGNNLKSI